MLSECGFRAKADLRLAVLLFCLLLSREFLCSVTECGEAAVLRQILLTHGPEVAFKGDILEAMCQARASNAELYYFFSS